MKAAQQRLKANGDNAADDDGVPLRGEELEYLEVAHIIPHALASSDDNLLVRFLPFVYSKDTKLVCLRIMPRHMLYEFSTCSILALSAGSKAPTLTDHPMLSPCPSVSIDLSEA